MAAIDRNRGAKRAREAREALGLSPMDPLRCLLTIVEDGAGHPVVLAKMPDEVAGACSSTAAGPVLWVNGTQSATRQRFTLAHELGHACCGHDGRVEVDTFETLGGKTSSPYEVQANAFAAEFLVPRAGLDEIIDREPTLEDTVIVANGYGVSAIMVVYRFKTLGLASAERIAELEADVADSRHLGLAQQLGLTPRKDRLAKIDGLPYLSPALQDSALAAALRGNAPASAGLARAIERLLS